MLLNLFIKDFGIIEKTDIDLGPGLNILSGETGSGKSVIIDAIQVVSGGRSSTEYIRAGCERSIIQLTADISGLKHIEGLISERGINSDGAGIIVMSRELNRSRSICRINSQITTLNVYREFGQALIDIQGQHDQMILFAPKHLQLLDAYGGEEIAGAAAGVKWLYREWAGKRKIISDLQEKYREWARRQDMLVFQVNEIDSADPVPGEDGELESEKRKLVNIEKLSALVNDCYQCMYGGGPAESMLDLAGKSVKNLDRAAELDPGLYRARELASQSLYQADEACRELSAYMDSLEFYPARLEHIEGRLELLDRLKKKYGETIEEILSYRDEINKELSEILDGDQRLGSLKTELDDIERRLVESASALTEKRKKCARQLEKDIKKELIDLEMAGAEFVIDFTGLDCVGETGSEKAEFYLSANTGEPVRPLSRIASGGEASRILLAVKGILAEMEETPSLVFDEVDTGIGGITINSVALKLKKLSARRQVICVTHSPSVASAADRHMAIRKIESGGRTVAGVVPLEDNERVDELASIPFTASMAAVDHARQMLARAGKDPLPLMNVFESHRDH
ncbi:MAG: DNA repair protein RecN [Actinobacteria bacterium]|nr:DNA repair protein RecN [Actinomycetota bacterium]